MSFHARLTEDLDFGPSTSNQPSKTNSAFIRLIRTLNLERKQFGIDLLIEFQTDNLRLDEIERLEAINDHINCNSSAFRHLDANLRYYCRLCQRKLTFPNGLTHLNLNEHLFRFTVQVFPFEYERIATLETFEEQLAAIKSLLEKIADKLQDFFNVEPDIIKIRNLDQDIKRYTSTNQIKFFEFHPNISRKFNEPEKQPVIVKQQAEDIEDDDGAFVYDKSSKSNKARLVSNTSMEDLTQTNKRYRSSESAGPSTSAAAALVDEPNDSNAVMKQSESMLEMVLEDNESEMNSSQASNFDVLFDEENDDYSKYIDRLNERLVNVAQGTGELDDGYLTALYEFFENLDLSNNEETLRKFKEVVANRKD